MLELQNKDGANMLIESKQIKEVLIKALEEYRVKSKTATNEYARASLDNVSRVLETLLVFINESERNEEALDMSELQSKLVQQMVSINDIEILRRSSELENELIKTAKNLTGGSYEKTTRRQKCDICSSCPVYRV